MIPTPAPSPSPFLIQVVGDGNSFWDSPFFIALLTLLGVAVGAGLTYWFGRLEEARRTKREDLRRWDEGVLEHVSNAISYAAKFEQEILAANKALAAAVASGSSTFPLRAYPVYDQLSEECHALELISPLSVRSAVVKLRFEAALVYSSWRTLTLSGPSHGSRVGGMKKASNNLQSAVRKHFGLT